MTNPGRDREVQGLCGLHGEPYPAARCGALIGFPGCADGTAEGRGEANPDQLPRYIENGGFYQAHVPEGAAYMKPWNAAYQDWAVATSS